MKRLAILATGLLALTYSTSAHADPYGTIVHKDGTMTAIYKSRSRTNVAYAAKFNKKGKFIGGCVREPMSAYQLRKALMRAQSRWRAGYIPRKYPCQW